MRVTVIGGSGFIGTSLVRRLCFGKDLPFSIVDIRSSADFPSHVRIADVRNLDQLRSTIDRNDILVNLAAEHRDDVRPRSLYREVNVDGAVNICRIAREKGVKKIIFTSSVAVYGFAPIGTDECGAISPFNEYGRTKYMAETIFTEWQREDSLNRSLVIIRPTVVFGEDNRGNVYNLLRMISAKRFFMIGRGENIKSVSYVENLAAFIVYSLSMGPGVHLYNYVDKPDLSMSSFIDQVFDALGRKKERIIRVPFVAAFLAGLLFDFIGFLTRRNFAVSAIRVKKFCANSCFETRVPSSGFVAPVPLPEALRKTVLHEFKKNQEKI